MDIEIEDERERKVVEGCRQRRRRRWIGGWRKRLWREEEEEAEKPWKGRDGK